MPGCTCRHEGPTGGTLEERRKQSEEKMVRSIRQLPSSGLFTCVPQYPFLLVELSASTVPCRGPVSKINLSEMLISQATFMQASMLRFIAQMQFFAWLRSRV